ncbi:ribonuclease H-like domain-containing protein [Poronia punctata]|nr:ribonuclease H-like domain-containing protein [Poronia punctata]
MVFLMKFNVDGGCRNNGRHGAIGAAACCLMLRGGRIRTRGVVLPCDGPYFTHTATNQRAELLALLTALDWAAEKYRGLKTSPRFKVMIHSDSRYAVDCMTKWVPKWLENGWRNASGRPVANADLIDKVHQLEELITLWGSVQYIWIPRSENKHADRACNEYLDNYRDHIYGPAYESIMENF